MENYWYDMEHSLERPDKGEQVLMHRYIMSGSIYFIGEFDGVSWRGEMGQVVPPPDHWKAIISPETEERFAEQEAKRCLE